MQHKLQATKRLLLLAVLILTGLQSYSQTPPSNLEGEELKEWFRTNYYDGKHNSLGYSTARKYMYNYIDNQNNTITCVYSGYEKSWTYGGTGTNPSPINCEHTIPQSFFDKDEPMRSDIHHLFPTYENWNSARSNYPFDDIPDAQTTKWMYLDSYQTSIPASNIDMYSEYYSNTFEPREDHKGNVARAVFYFFTMYPTQAGNISSVADPDLLYQWHIADPVDADEISRNDKIETYQGNRNPYVDYPGKVALAWGFEEPLPTNEYCSSKGNNASYEWISEIQIGTFSHSSGSSSYSDYTGTTVNLSTGNTSISLVPGFSGSTYNEYWKIWIDLNADGDFDDANENVFDQGSMSSSTVTGNLYIPSGYELSTRMRVSMKYNGEPTSCETFSYGEVEDYTVQISSSVTPPVADFNANTTTIIAGESISFTDLSTNSPTSWSWTFSGGSPTSSTLQNPTITYNTAGTYAVSLTAANSGGNGSETKTAYITVSESSVSYCTSQGNNYNYEYISEVEIGSYSNTSSGSNYSDFTNEIIPVSTGSNSIALTPEFPGGTYTEYWKIWIDFNKDGDFTDSGEEVFSSTGSTSTVNGTISIPSGFNGETRMRITMKYASAPSSCETFSYGEVEDYTVSTTATKSAGQNLQQIINSKNILIYPTPANEYINISITDESNLCGTASLTDLQGKLLKVFILTENTENIDVSDILPGIYLLKVNIDNNNFIKQIIIE
jgi:PKD repeat protein